MRTEHPAVTVLTETLGADTLVFELVIGSVGIDNNPLHAVTAQLFLLEGRGKHVNSWFTRRNIWGCFLHLRLKWNLIAKRHQHLLAVTTSIYIKCTLNV